MYSLHALQSIFGVNSVAEAGHQGVQYRVSMANAAYIRRQGYAMTARCSSNAGERFTNIFDAVNAAQRTAMAAVETGTAPLQHNTHLLVRCVFQSIALWDQPVDCLWAALCRADLMIIYHTMTDSVKHQRSSRHLPECMMLLGCHACIFLCTATCSETWKITLCVV